MEMGLNTNNSHTPGEQHQEKDRSGESMVENKKKHKDEVEEEKDPDQDNSESTATRRSSDPTAEGLPPMVEIASQTLVKLTNEKNTESQPESTAYQIIVADAADAVSVNFSGRCKFLQI